MTDYRVLSRRYRPQQFRDVVGQVPIVITLKNALKFKRLAHAYLFCGPRGTGKTTFARLIAKALNCDNPSAEQEPCNLCTSCKQISNGGSLDVIEIDGASHRGIDDIRQINDTVAFVASPGKFKIYIIDEVHMLTKEAFNALLKTLEEPPPNVKFLFATTEPHRIPATILSRCQRLNLQRLTPEKITGKLQQVLKDEKLPFESRALDIIASMAEGCLRDAESLLEQVLAYRPTILDIATVTQALGIIPFEDLFALHQAIKQQRFAAAFELSQRLYQEGKDLAHFLKSLFEHFRNLLLILLGTPPQQLSGAIEIQTQYKEAAQDFSLEQCEYILELLLKAQEAMRLSATPLIVLEMTLLKIIRSKFYLPLTTLVQRLTSLEKRLSAAPAETAPLVAAPTAETPETAPKSAEVPRKQQSHYDTLLQFAAVELEGSIKKG